MEEILNRIKTAIEFLKEGFPFRVEELYFGMSEGNLLNVTGASQFIDLKNVTKIGALKELDEIKSIFEKMVLASPELRLFLANKKVKFNLDFDYGMGDTRICSELDGIIFWETDLKK